MKSFHDWLERVQSGDPVAATEFVRRYEPAIRQAVRVRLVHFRLGRYLDATDIRQSVLSRFFARAAEDRFVIDSPDRLRALLTTMARNKVQDEARKQQAARRNHGRLIDTLPAEGLDGLIAKGPTPSRVVAGRELVAEIRRRFTSDERLIFEARSQGQEWTQIAAGLGTTAEAVRKKLARALDRIVRELGLEPQQGL